MALFSRIMQISDLDEIIDFEQKKLLESVADENDRLFQSWHARWRKESLECYLPMGWSFLIRDPELKSSFSTEGQLIGYFIAQPLLFFDGYTQSLWVEHVSFSSIQARDSLCELSYRLAREKNFQKVYFPQVNGVSNSIASFKPDVWSPSVLVVKTSKSST